MSDVFIRRPIATSLIMLAIALFGVMAYRGLPVSDLPNVDFPTLVVTANLPGANPETMASAVATPLERQFSTIAGLDSMSSTSAMGTTQITLQFDLSSGWTARRSTCRRPSHRLSRCCRRGCRIRRPSARTTRPISRSFISC